MLYHKEPVKSSDFVTKDVWQQTPDYNPNMLLVHARGASKGLGDPRINYNNHPFTSLDKTIGLIHNGRIDDCEYYHLKQKYDLKTQCDSELLLRIFESGDLQNKINLNRDFGDFDYSHRLAGIRDIFSFINEGHMAVAIGERISNGSRMLWLFRNKYRPLWMVDMRQLLGQIFFVSEFDIWEDAIYETESYNELSCSQKVIELPKEEVWLFQIDIENPCPNFQKYEVCKNNKFYSWKFDGKKNVNIKNEVDFSIITELNDNDELKITM